MKHRIDRRTKVLMAERRRNNRITRWAENLVICISSRVVNSLNELTKATSDASNAIATFADTYKHYLKDQ